VNESKVFRLSEGTTMVEGRCMKCKGPVEIKNGKEVTMKNGMRAMKGECPKCATKVFRILGKAK
jgi:DNA-directed RNA polymerase subunit RPC12/RpoP